jgi:putative methanogenesis marker protein 8
MVEHKLEMAKALVVIKDGEIIVQSDPKVRRCPLRGDIYGCQEENAETVKRVLQKHMSELGMYGINRILDAHEVAVSFGASEIINNAMVEGLVDAAVVVCEGAGTVVVDRPEVLQAIGAHMTGLLSTEPIREIQDGLKKRGCLLLDDSCMINQLEGFKKAVESGFLKIAITIDGQRAFEAAMIKAISKNSVRQPIILAVHTTGISEDEALALANNCDIVWACASKAVRDVVGKRAKLQIGVSIPVFALTFEGKRLILNRALHFEDGLVIRRGVLPYLPKDKQPEPLI